MFILNCGAKIAFILQMFNISLLNYVIFLFNFSIYLIISVYGITKYRTFRKHIYNNVAVYFVRSRVKISFCTPANCGRFWLTVFTFCRVTVSFRVVCKGKEWVVFEVSSKRKGCFVKARPQSGLGVTLVSSKRDIGRSLMKLSPPHPSGNKKPAAPSYM